MPGSTRFATMRNAAHQHVRRLLTWIARRRRVQLLIALAVGLVIGAGGVYAATGGDDHHGADPTSGVSQHRDDHGGRDND